MTSFTSFLTKWPTKTTDFPFIMECLQHTTTDTIIVRCRLSLSNITSSVTSAVRTSRIATSYCTSTFTDCWWLAEYWQQSLDDTADLWLTSVLYGRPVYSCILWDCRTASRCVRTCCSTYIQTLLSMTKHSIATTQPLFLCSKIKIYYCRVNIRKLSTTGIHNRFSC